MKGFPGLITIVRDLIPEDNFEESCKSCRIRWVPNKVAILHPTLFLSHHEAEGSGQPVLRDGSDRDLKNTVVCWEMKLLVHKSEIGTASFEKRLSEDISKQNKLTRVNKLRINSYAIGQQLFMKR
ncbi:unnamed protein product [Lepidochelys kempii]